MARQQVWLTLPQAVVLRTTRDLDRALEVTGKNPDLHLVKANQFLGRLASVPLHPEVTEQESRKALRRLREENFGGKHKSRYLEVQQKVAELLGSGIPVRGSRKPGGALKKISPSEFTRLELRGLHAMDRLTGKVVFYDLRIEAIELLEKLGETAPHSAVLDVLDTRAERTRPQEPTSTRTEEWNVRGDPTPALIEWARRRWGDDLWRLPNADGLLRAHREQFGRQYGISEKTMRAVRAALAPKKARRGGAPTHRR